MAVMLERWNDDKMDSLDGRVEQIEGELVEQRRELGAFRREVSSRFDAMQRTMIMATVGILGTFVTGFGILVGLVVAM
jgi:hypothetical protein